MAGRKRQHDAHDDEPNSKKGKGNDDLSLILEKLTKIEKQNTEIVKSVSSVEVKIATIEQKLVAAESTSEELKQSLCEVKTEMSTSISQNSTRIDDMETKLADLTSKFSKIQSEKLVLHSEVNKLNLVLCGHPDSKDESTDKLATEIQAIIRSITKKDITIDCAFRIGNYKPNSCRQVKVKFLSLLERNFALLHRSELSHPYYLNEDLPFETRRTQAILRQKKKALLQLHPDADIKINWKQNTLSHGNILYTVVDGIISSTRNDLMDMDFLGLDQGQPNSLHSQTN